MPKNNKVTKRVFAKIAETNGRKGAYDSFLGIDKEMGLPETDLLISMKERYSEIAKDCVDDVKILAALEEIIIQMRAKNVIDSELRLSLSRDYIYARTLFYRKDNKINDIRVVVGKVDQYGDDLDKLINDQIFRTICWAALTKVMDKEIEANINQLNLIFNEKII